MRRKMVEMIDVLLTVGTIVATLFGGLVVLAAREFIRTRSKVETIWASWFGIEPNGKDDGHVDRVHEMSETLNTIDMKMDELERRMATDHMETTKALSILTKQSQELSQVLRDDGHDITNIEEREYEGTYEDVFGRARVVRDNGQWGFEFEENVLEGDD